MTSRPAADAVRALGIRVLACRTTTIALWVGSATIAAIAVDALLLLLIRPPRGPLPEVNVLAGRFVFACGLVSVAVVVTVLTLRFLRRAHPQRRSASAPVAGGGARSVTRETAVAGVLTLGALLVLSVAPTYLLARASQPPHEIGVLYGYVDRRWLVAAYLLATLGPMVLLVILTRITGTAPATPCVTPAETPAGVPAETPASSGRRLGPGWARGPWFRLALGALLAWYFFGPPWGIAYNQQPIDAHEIFQLGALQAQTAGAMPYIGAAGSQYGPGSQFVAWLYMHVVGTFSVVGFREVFALFQWTAATVIFGVLMLRLRLSLALATVLLAVLVFPTLNELGFGNLGRLTPHDSFGGFFGWFNLWRYTGVLVLLMLFPRVVGPVRLRALRAVGLGALWGLACYVAQENLGAGLLGLAVLTLLLVGSGSAHWRHATRALGAVALGAVTVWVPVVIVYAVHGTLRPFITNYFLVPSAVTQGYSDTSFQGGLISDWGPLFYLLPVFLCLVGLASLIQLRPLRIATNWSEPRTLLISVAVVSMVSYTGALLRSDASHLINTTLSLPLLIVLVVALLPKLLGLQSRVAAAALGLFVIAVTAATLPVSSFGEVPHRLWAPAAARYALLTQGAPPRSASLAGRRIGPDLARAPTCCATSIDLTAVPMPELVDFFDRLHALIGRRRTYVTSDLLDATGLIYFGADLAPARMYVEPGTMLIDQEVRQRFMDYFQAHIREVGALVTHDAPTPELRMFVAAFPRFHDVHLVVDGQDVHVLFSR